jgi:riboflavin kinase/FMN adenylyltransferase
MLFLSQFAIIQSMRATQLIWGKVRPGNKRGKTLGFPTANFALHRDIAEGVYLAKVKINNNIFLSLTFVGAAKTFNEREKKAESYILNFNKNIYGQWITVNFLKKIRGNIKFKSEKELIQQMQKDLLIAKEFFKI